MNYTDLIKHLEIRGLESGHHHCRPGWIQFDCPDCGPGSRKYHLGLQKSSGYFNCWVCGRKPLLQTLCSLSGWASRDVIPLLKDILPSRPVRTAVSGVYKPPRGVFPLAAAHRKYLAGRGFDPDEIAALWGVQGIGIASNLSWRLFLPIVYRYETVSWTTRTIGENTTRYISAKPEEERISHKHLLYGIDMCAHAVIIVEGPTDAWRIGPGAAATLGLAYTPEQMELMRSFPVRVVCFDNSSDAQRRARRLSDVLSLFPGETYQANLSGKDPDTSPAEEIQELRKRFLE